MPFQPSNTPCAPPPTAYMRSVRRPWVAFKPNGTGVCRCSSDVPFQKSVTPAPPENQISLGEMPCGLKITVLAVTVLGTGTIEMSVPLSRNTAPVLRSLLPLYQTSPEDAPQIPNSVEFVGAFFLV